MLRSCKDSRSIAVVQGQPTEYESGGAFYRQKRNGSCGATVVISDEN